MTLDPVMLSRLQWSWVIAWHILLPAFTVGLASYIAVLEGLYLITGQEIWFRISGFWTRIFAVSFGMGVVSGIIMPFQFGTNWSRFTDAAISAVTIGTGESKATLGQLNQRCAMPGCASGVQMLTAAMSPRGLSPSSAQVASTSRSRQCRAQPRSPPHSHCSPLASLA